MGLADTSPERVRSATPLVVSCWDPAGLGNTLKLSRLRNKYTLNSLLLRLFPVSLSLPASLLDPEIYLRSLINMDVPTATSLGDIYPEDALPVETKRWERLLAKFKDLYGKQAEFVARSPGRVNIIGEVNLTLYLYQTQ
jgi:hypothetical protein